jgi:hypothetical protein
MTLVCLHSRERTGASETARRCVSQSAQSQCSRGVQYRQLSMPGAVHTSQLPYMVEGIEDTISKLEGVGVAETVLDLGVDNELR